MTLLPPNSSPLERRFSDEVLTLNSIPINIHLLGDIDQVPAKFLSYLAWQYSVDRWDDTWPESVKRALIKSSFSTHEIKGTIASIRNIASAWGFTLNVVEWWQTTPQGIPGTFSLDILTNGNVLTSTIYTVLMQLIKQAIPLTRHITALQLKVDPIPIQLSARICVCDGIETILYPYVPDLTVPVSSTVVMYDSEETTIYPSA